MERRLTVVAGAGSLVPHVIEAARESGYAIQVLSLTDRSDLTDVPVKPANLKNPLAAVAAVRGFRTSHIVMAGGVQISDAVREGLAKFAFGSKADDRKVGGDSGISGLGKVVKSIFGADLVGVHEIAPDLIAGQGLLVGSALSEREQDAAEFAIDIARRIGMLDVGQAVVVSGRRVVAVEDIAGTDSMLLRVERFRKDGLTGDGKWPLVLAKACKPGQPVYVDLPAIGPNTVTGCNAAGIRVIAVDANHSLILERARTLDLARGLGVSIVGLAAEGEPH